MSEKKKLRIATTSLAGCFGCHMSFLDIDEKLIPLLELVEFDRSPLTDIKHCGPCDIGLVEGGICNGENVHVLHAVLCSSGGHHTPAVQDRQPAPYLITV